MSRKVNTIAGFKNVLDRKVIVDGAFRNVGRRVVVKDGQFHTTWQRQKPAIGLTQWHPRWARIAYENGYTEIAYTDELGTPVTTTAIACVGNRTNGTVYYTAGNKMYKQDLATGVVSLLWTRTDTFSTLQINEETGAAFIVVGNNRLLAPSIEALGTASIIANIANASATGSSVQKWVNGLILFGANLYDSNAKIVKTLPSLGYTAGLYSFPILDGNEQDGYYIVTAGTFTGQASNWNLWQYFWDSNTVTVLFNFSSLTNILVSIDSVNAAVLLAGDVVNSVSRTINGINKTPVNGSVGGGSALLPGGWQHIGINILNSAFWNSNSDTVGNASTNNSLFPGYLGGSVGGSNFYAGKQMLLNRNRLWDIVPK
jgi:hypothetical protein